MPPLGVQRALREVARSEENIRLVENGVTVVEMRMLAEIELHLAPGVEADL
jgi:hypothetical protein